jgi:HEAT repeat protein
MMTKEIKTAATPAGTAAVIAHASHTTGSGSVNDLVAKIKSTDEDAHGPAAWQEAGPAGAPAVKPLAALLTDSNFEVARSAKRALYRIVYHTGRPGAESEARAVEAELIPLLKNDAAPVRREMLWLLSEIGGEDAVTPMATLLTNLETREDARCALERLPSVRATAALQSAFTSAPEDFKFALAESLRHRGEKITGYPSKKLVPTKQTSVR